MNTHRGASKELNQVRSLARQQNWTCSPAKSGHLRWDGPFGGQPIYTSATPNGKIAITRIKNDLANAGLIIDMDVWNTHKKRLKTLIDLMSEKYNSAALSASLDEAGMDVEMTQAQVKDMCIVAAVLDLDRKPANMACPCGKQYADKMMQQMHLVECPSFDVPLALMGKTLEPLGDELLKRDLSQPPPERERLNCTRCAWYCWNTQPHMLEAHMAAEHDLAVCSACATEMKPSSLQAHMDKTCSVLHPRVTPPVPVPAIVEIADKVGVEPEAPKPTPVTNWKCDVCGDVIKIKGKGPHKSKHERERRERIAHNDEQTRLSVEREQAASAVARGVEKTDDELWTLMELVLDGPIMFNRETMEVVEEWKAATRKLLALKGSS